MLFVLCAHMMSQTQHTGRLTSNNSTAYIEGVGICDTPWVLKHQWFSWFCQKAVQVHTHIVAKELRLCMLKYAAAGGNDLVCVCIMVTVCVVPELVSRTHSNML